MRRFDQVAELAEGRGEPAGQLLFRQSGEVCGETGVDSVDFWAANRPLGRRSGEWLDAMDEEDRFEKS